MKSKGNIINAVGRIGIAVLTLGIMFFLFGLFENDYKIFVSIGIGTVVGAVFIFLIGVFFVATEEMLAKTNKGNKVIPIKSKKGAPL
nr:hypothetical protein [Neobacillus sp. Marseille-Q6967]